MFLDTIYNAFSNISQSKVCSNQHRLVVIMSMENAAQGDTMVEEEEEAVMKNLQSDGSGSYHSPEDEFVYLLQKRGLRKVQMTMTPTIFLSSKRYGNPQVS
jgi:hypothetical protein